MTTTPPSTSPTPTHVHPTAPSTNVPLPSTIQALSRPTDATESTAISRTEAEPPAKRARPSLSECSRISVPAGRTSNPYSNLRRRTPIDDDVALSLNANMVWGDLRKTKAAAQLAERVFAELQFKVN